MKVEVKNEIYSIFEARAKEKGEFKNTEDYINSLLKQIAERLGSEKQRYESGEKEVKEKLKKLGYLD